jgi:CRISPR-associated protein Cas2
VLVIVCYDVATADRAGAKRLRKVATTCKDYGVRVQYSVFECRLTPADWVALRARLLSEYKPDEDSLRFYFLCESDAQRTEHHGVRKSFDPTAPLVV